IHRAPIVRRSMRESAMAGQSSDPSAAGVPADATCGLRVHSGWAALVAVAGPLAAPAVLARRRIELVDEASPGGRQPFHAARNLLARCRVQRGVAAGDLERHLAELGRTLGPPWRQDEKLATLAAWLALASLGQADATIADVPDVV